MIIVQDAPTCNRAWNIGIPHARGDLIHLSSDDIEAQPGWWQAGLTWLEQDILPAPRIINPDGTLQSCGDGDWEQETGSHTELTRVPFFTREMMDRAGLYPIQPAYGQYFGDAWVSAKARMSGIKTVVVREMQFIHAFSNVGRLDDMLYPDRDAFFVAVREAS